MTDNITDGGKVHADAWSTEHAAAEAQTTERKRATYDRIVNLMRHYAYRDDLLVHYEGAGYPGAGWTDDELRAGLAIVTGTSQSKSGPATRRGELVDLGYVRPQRDEQGAIVKRPSDGGRPMIVWELVPAAEYVKPAPRSAEREPNARGLVVARRFADWDTGDPELGNGVVRAYLNPELVAAELDDMGAL
jgi:hypothetical protein